MVILLCPLVITIFVPALMLIEFGLIDVMYGVGLSIYPGVAKVLIGMSNKLKAKIDNICKLKVILFLFVVIIRKV